MNSRRYILGLGRWRGLLERDVCRSCDCPPGEPTEVYRYRRPAGLGLDGREKAQDAASENSAVAGDIAARHLYEKFPEPAWTAFRRRTSDLLGDGAMNKVLPAWGPSCA